MRIITNQNMSDITALFVQKSENEIEEELIRRTYLGEINRSNIESGLNKLSIAVNSAIPTLIDVNKRLMRLAKEEYESKEKDELSPFILSVIEERWKSYETQIKKTEEERERIKEGLEKGEEVYKKIKSSFLFDFEDYCKKREEYEKETKNIFNYFVSEINKILHKKKGFNLNNFEELNILKETEKIKNSALETLIKEYEELIKKYEERVTQKTPELLDELKKTNEILYTIPACINKYNKEIIEDRIDSIIREKTNPKDISYNYLLHNCYVSPYHLQKFARDVKEDHNKSMEKLKKDLEENEIYFKENKEHLEHWLYSSKNSGREEMVKKAESSLEALRSYVEDKKKIIEQDMNKEVAKYNLIKEYTENLSPKFRVIRFYNRLTKITTNRIKEIEATENNFKIKFKEIIERTREKLNSNNFFAKLPSYIERFGESKIAYII